LVLSSKKQMSQHPDQRYIEAVLRGDTNAYSLLVDRYKNMVFAIAIGILKNREDAEEASQDVFLKAYRALKTFRGNAAFSTWLYRIAYRSSLDHLKRRRNMPEPANEVLQGRLVAPVRESYLQQEEEDEQKIILKRAIAALDGGDQVIIKLFYYDERSLKEIAEIMEISVNTAKVRLFRSRDRLMQIVGKISKGEIIK
jgi:RNA polymerase sigma factor (sigma-70 family)